MRFFFAVMLAICLSLPALGLQPGQILDLTDLGPGVVPTAINNHGMIVGQHSSGQAFMWQNGTMINLGTLGGSQSYANDINDNGIVVGWSLDDNGLKKAFRFDNTLGSMQNIDPLTNFSSSAEAINSIGDAVGWKNNGSASRSSIWTPADPNGQLVFGGGSHQAFGINDQGQIVGVAFNAAGNPDEGFYWDPSDPIAGISGGLSTNFFPYAGLNNESLAAGEISGVSGAYMNLTDSSETLTGLLNQSDLVSSILGLNDVGDLVGYSGSRGIAYDLATGNLMDMNSFMKTGFEADAILRITDINNNGQFVGVANFNGVEHGFSGFGIDPQLGDFDFDGDVDGRDFLLWQRNPGVGALVDWQANYGNPTGPDIVGSVPEPNTGALLAWSLVAFLIVGRNKPSAVPG